MADLSPAGAVVDGKIYVISGYSIDGTVTVVEEYDPSTDTCTSKTDIPTPRWGLSISVVDGKIYAIGGGDWPDQNSLSIVEVYDPAVDPLNPTSIEAVLWGALKATFR